MGARRCSKHSRRAKEMAGTEVTGAIRGWEAEAILIQGKAGVILTRDRAEEMAAEGEMGEGRVAVGRTSRATWTPERCGN
jgi:ABC-type sugar transport system substrate-binding protein